MCENYNTISKQETFHSILLVQYQSIQKYMYDQLVSSNPDITIDSFVLPCDYRKYYRKRNEKLADRCTSFNYAYQLCLLCDPNHSIVLSIVRPTLASYAYRIYVCMYECMWCSLYYNSNTDQEVRHLHNIAYWLKAETGEL